MRQSASVARGTQLPAGTVRIRNTSTRQVGGRSTGNCSGNEGGGCDARCAAGGDGRKTLTELSVGDNMQGTSAEQKSNGGSCSCAHETNGGDVTKKNDSVRIAKLLVKSKSAVDKMLKKIKNRYLFVDAVHPVESAAALKRASDCIVDGIMAKQPVVSPEDAQKIAQEAGAMVSRMFIVTGAEQKANNYLSAEIVRFSDHLVQSG